MESAASNRLSLTGAAIGALRCGLAVLLFGSVSTSAGTGAPQSPSPPGMVQVTIEVELSCPSCAIGLERRLGRLDHVAGIEVSPPDGQIVLAVEPGHRLDLVAVWDTVRNAGFIPDGVAVIAIGHVTEVNGAPALALAPDYALPFVEGDGLTALATEAGDQRVEVSGHWSLPPEGGGRLRVESFEVR